MMLGFSDLQGRVDMLHISGLGGLLEKVSLSLRSLSPVSCISPRFSRVCWRVFLGKVKGVLTSFSG